MRTMRAFLLGAALGLSALPVSAQRRPARPPAKRDKPTPERSRPPESASRSPQPEAGVRVEVAGIGGVNRAYGGRLDVDVPIKRGVWEISGRFKAFRDPKAFEGTIGEGSIAGLRRLYHTTIGARFGLKPPNSESASYRLTQYWTTLTFYGLKLGPEKPELAYYLWEKGGPPTWIEPYGRAFVTRIHALYTKTEHKLERLPLSRLELTQHTSQFELRETFKDRHSVAVQFGWNLYSLELSAQDAAVHLDNVSYPGGAFPIRGWPNQFYGAQGWSEFKPGWRLDWGFSRVGLLEKRVEALTSAGLERVSGDLRARAAYHQRHRLGAETRQGFSGTLSYRF